MKGFDDVAEQINKKKLKDEERVKRVEAITAEKERFEKDGLTPWSALMRSHLSAYQKNLGLADAALRKVYDGAIGVALNAKDQKEVNRLRADRDTALDVKVVAIWSHYNPGLKTWDELKLYSNGKVGAPDDERTWIFRNGVLSMRWPNPTAPGGAWVDALSVSDDGRKYSGTNQKGTRLSGKLKTK